MLQKQATAVQAHLRQTSAELIEFHRSGSSECASNVNQKSSQRHHDTAGHSIQNSDAIASRVVVGLNLPDEINQFVNIARTSCLEHLLRRCYFLTCDEVTDSLISF